MAGWARFDQHILKKNVSLRDVRQPLNSKRNHERQKSVGLCKEIVNLYLVTGLLDSVGRLSIWKFTSRMD